MKCEKCGEDFLEKDIDDSHDVPCYLFGGYNRQQKKSQADKFPRRWLCRECHLAYENRLRKHLQSAALLFSYKYFGESDEHPD